MATNTTAADATTSGSAFVTSVVINSATGLIFTVLFLLLRSSNVSFYGPRLKELREAGFTKHIPARNPLALLQFLFRLSREDVLRHAGIDAYLFCRFMQMGVYLFASLTYVRECAGADGRVACVGTVGEGGVCAASWKDRDGRPLPATAGRGFLRKSPAHLCAGAMHALGAMCARTAPCPRT
jgi:hypothetical protein